MGLYRGRHFNDIVKPCEKRGGRSVAVSSLRGLRHFLECFGFFDLGFSGRNFTWTNGQLGLACIRERLDRSITNVRWHTSYPNAGVKHFSITNSDHVPLILSLVGGENSVPKCFKFEKF